MFTIIIPNLYNKIYWFVQTNIDLNLAPVEKNRLTGNFTNTFFHKFDLYTNDSRACCETFKHNSLVESDKRRFPSYYPWHRLHSSKIT